MIFSDETRISRYRSDARLWFWSKNGEQLSDIISKPTVKGRGGGFILRSCIGYNGAGYVTRITGTMNAEFYAEVLQNEMKAFIEYCVPPQHRNDFIFQHENAPCHKA